MVAIAFDHDRDASKCIRWVQCGNIRVCLCVFGTNRDKYKGLNFSVTPKGRDIKYKLHFFAMTNHIPQFPFSSAWALVCTCSPHFDLLELSM